MESLYVTNLQKNLRSGGSISELEEKFAIKCTRHSKYNNLVLFKYNQIESPFSEQIVRECRGIILDENDDWNVVAFPFIKFFNYGEGHAANIDWETSYVQEKVDGSLMTIYVYDNQWHVASSGTPDAGGQVNDFGFSFADLFWKAFDQYDIVLPKKDCGYCFFFELTSQYNKIVVRHAKPGLTLLGARNLVTQKEITATEALKFFEPWDAERRSDSRRSFDKLTTAKQFPLYSFDEIVATFPSIDPLTQEGYVVVDASFNRVKVKSPAYIALHHMKDSCGSVKALFQIAVNGEIDEVVSAFPEYKEMLFDIKSKLNSLISELENDFERLKGISLQKDFALEACKTRCSSALFAVRAGKAPDISTHIRNMSPDRVMEMLDLK